MRALLVFLMATSACSFSGSGGSGNPDGGPDGKPDGMPDGMPDGQPDGMPMLPCLSGVYDLCAGAPAPTGPLAVVGTQRVNTDLDANCRRIIPQASGPAICVQYYTTVSVPIGTTLIAHGSRAYALYASTSITIGGILDVSSHRDSQVLEPGAGHVSNCTFGGDPEEDAHGGGGGAGGTYAAQGGAGGDGDVEMGSPADNDGKGGIAGAAAPFSVLRGGCQGQSGQSNQPTTGNGGRGGGAVYLASRTIQITGSVRATGAAGNGGGVDGRGGGGGGGGSGGTIVIQGFTTATVTGMLLATGGGGGQGGSGANFGEPGAEPTNTNAAEGGDMIDRGGFGGDGSTADVGSPGTSDDFGGGGGGGGSGYIRIYSPAATTGAASAAPAPVVAAQ